jgi:glycosyltransferase involved in cell wall biosynthesis
MDIELFAGKLNALLADKQLARDLGARGRERFERDYNFDEYITRLESIFNHVAQEHHCLA